MTPQPIGVRERRSSGPGESLFRASPFPFLPAPPVLWALLALTGIWSADALRPWMAHPGMWWAGAVLSAAFALGRGRRLWPAVPRHPARRGGWWPEGGPLTGLALAFSVVCLAATHYLVYVQSLAMGVPEAGELREWVGRVVEPPEVREGYVRFVLQPEAPAGSPGARVEVRVADPPQVEGFSHPYRPFRPEPGQRVHLRAWVRRPQPARWPGAFSEQRFYEGRGIGAIAWVPHVRHIRVLESGRQGPSPWPAALALRWRQGVEATLEAHLPSEQAGLLLSMIFGDRTRIDSRLEDAFRRSGLMHLLAVSGLHVGFVAALVAFVVGLLHWSPWVSALVGGGVVGLYVLATGARPPAVRAGIMAFMALGAWALHRRRDLPTAAALALLGLLLFRPTLALDLSFQLSFAATMAIGAVTATLAPWWRSHGGGKAGEWGPQTGEWEGPLRRWVAGAWRWLVSGVLVSSAAQLATAPLLLRTFGEVAVLGPVANLLAVPLAGLAVPVGLVGGTAGALVMTISSHLGGGPMGEALGRGGGWLAAAMVKTAGFLTGGLARWAQELARLPLEPLQAPPPDSITVALWYGLLVSLGVLTAPGPARPLMGVVDWHLRKKPVLRALGAVVALLTLWAWFKPLPPVEIYFFDVGQGAAALLRTRWGHTFLLDGGRGSSGPREADGYDAGRRVILPALQALGVRRLTAVINSHPHEDHVGGLMDVVTAMPVGEWWDAVPEGQDLTGASPSYLRALALLEAASVPRRVLRAGQRIHLGNGVVLEVLHPTSRYLQGTSSDWNNNSLTLRLTYGEDAWLFPSDLEWEGQDALLRRVAASVASTGFQVPHHGAAGSLWRPFWQAVNPDLAVIQVGRNAFGQPAPAALQTLEELGARVYRTDRHGTIRVWTWGRGWRARPWVAACPDRAAGVC